MLEKFNTSEHDEMMRMMISDLHSDEFCLSFLIYVYCKQTAAALAMCGANSRFFFIFSPIFVLFFLSFCYCSDLASLKSKIVFSIKANRFGDSDIGLCMNAVCVFFTTVLDQLPFWNS